MNSSHRNKDRMTAHRNDLSSLIKSTTTTCQLPLRCQSLTISLSSHPLQQRITGSRHEAIDHSKLATVWCPCDIMNRSGLVLTDTRRREMNRKKGKKKERKGQAEKKKNISINMKRYFSMKCKQTYTYTHSDIHTHAQTPIYI